MSIRLLSTPLLPAARPALAVLVLLVGVPALGAGQMGETTDIITGLVTDESGQPLAGVTIEALSLETQITRTTTSGPRGRFTILFPDGGGQYRMTARRIGMAPLQSVLVRYADEDRLVWEIRLSAQPFLLDPIEVEARLTPVRVPDRPTPGSQEQNLPPGVVLDLPIDPEDLTILATLVPGVVGVDATDSSEASVSVAGQRPDANAITLDGMTFTSGNVPQDGLRNTRVITSTYDVSRGRFSGGLIAATTRSGTNRVQGAAGYSLRDDDLSLETGENSPFTSGFTMHRVNGGLGGPLISNRLFAYVSAQGRLRRNPLQALTTATPADLERLGVAADSVTRFLEIADRVGALGGVQVDDNSANDNASALLRADYLVSNDHTLTLRGDLQRNNSDPTAVSQFGLPETGGVNESSGGGVMARLASRIGLSILNEARVYVSTSRRTGDAYLDLPQGRVQVASTLPDGSVGIRTLVLGGNARYPTFADETLVELANELSWLPGTGRHRIKVGGLVTSRATNGIRSGNQLGSFTFNSLADLETGAAALFRRTVAPTDRATHGIEYALYLGDVWRASPALQLTYGVRAEGGWFRNEPAYNPAIDSLFGRRTDRLPSEFSVSPRAGFTWALGGARLGGRPDWIIRGGAGAFRSPLPAGLVSAAQQSTGLETSESQVTCIGPAVPTPDWTSYAADAASIPAACDAVGGGPQLREPARNAVLIADDFGAPMAWRASLGLQRQLSSLLRASVNVIYARGVSQYGFADLNLDTDPEFRLDVERRPVYVARNQIVPETGAVRIADSRVDPAFAQVTDIESDLASETKQVTFSLSGFTRRGVMLQGSYTLSSVRDQSSSTARFGGGGFGSTSTAGNPNVPTWSRGGFERRHQFLATISYPFGTTLEVTGIGRLTSGTPYTPMVGGDINGDGSRNDRAFVFAPGAGAPPGVADGLQRLLATTSGSARSCLEKQLGQIAERNSCLGPWEGSFDLQLNYRPQFFGLAGNLSISLVTVNLLRGIDDLLHGQNAKGWGVRGRPDETLLFVTGFDPAARQFQYTVNERFGANRATGAAVRQPFQVGVQARFSFGPNRMRDAVDRLRGGGRGGAGGFGGGGGRPGDGGGFAAGGFGPDEFLARFQSLFPNPAEFVLELRDTLELTDDQVATLTVLADSLDAITDSLAGELEQQLAAAGSNSDPRELMALVRPTTQVARGHTTRAIAALRRILTDEQWERVPEQLRDAGRRVRPGGN